MRDLHVLTVAEDGRSLVLADSAGEQYSLPLDERLLASLRSRSARDKRSTPPVALSPREIQALVRAGTSAEQVASMAGIAYERVMRFAAPVLDERAHMAGRARRVLLRTDGMLELGTLDEVALTALARRGAESSAEWDAWRREDGRWIVACSWVEDDRDRTASWVLDASAGSATPLDDDARALAGLPTDVAQPAQPRGQTRLAVVPNPHPGTDDRPESAADLPGDDTSDPAAVIEDETPTGPIPTVTDDGAASGPPGSAHPARRARRAPVEDEPRLPLSDLAEHVEVDEPRGHRPVRDTGGRQRPAVPSWDEIMFGRRT